MIEVGEVGEELLLVERVGRSPLPDDPRRCAVVQAVFRRERS
jgi:hypothetical protein